MLGHETVLGTRDCAGVTRRLLIVGFATAVVIYAVSSQFLSYSAWCERRRVMTAAAVPAQIIPTKHFTVLVAAC